MPERLNLERVLLERRITWTSRVRITHVRSSPLFSNNLRIRESKSSSDSVPMHYVYFFYVIETLRRRRSSSILAERRHPCEYLIRRLARKKEKYSFSSIYLRKIVELSRLRSCRRQSLDRMERCLSAGLLPSIREAIIFESLPPFSDSSIFQKSKSR